VFLCLLCGLHWFMCIICVYVLPYNVYIVYINVFGCPMWFFVDVCMCCVVV